MRPSARFWDRIAKRYAAAPIKDEAAYARKLEATRAHFRPDMDVLELGCGTGSTALLHAPYVKRIRATDISPKMLQIARAKAAQAGVDNVTFEEAAIDTMALEPASWDAVLALSVLHLLADKEAAIAKVYAALKPGGVFVTSTACLGDTMAFLKYVAPLGRTLGFLPLVRVFTAAELEARIREAGFAIEESWLPGKGKALFLIARKPAD